MISRSEKKSLLVPFAHVLAWSLLLMASAVALIFFVGMQYFDATHSGSQRLEGDWSGINHLFYLLVTSPFLLIASFFWGGWMRMGRQPIWVKLTVALLILVAYGGAYLAFLRNTYPQ